MRRANLVCGGVLLALGVLALVETVRVKDDWQGARLMPAAVGVALVALGVAHLAPARAPAGTPGWPAGPRWRRVLFVYAALALYAAALPLLGFLAASALLVLVLLRASGAFSWPAALALSVTIAVASHVVFRRWLGLPLP